MSEAMKFGCINARVLRALYIPRKNIPISAAILRSLSIALALSRNYGWQGFLDSQY